MTQLNEGEKAPYFKGQNQDGKEITLDDFKGKYIGRVLPHVFAVLEPTPSYSQECINHMLGFFKAHMKIIND